MWQDMIFEQLKNTARRHHAVEEAERIARYILEDAYGITDIGKANGIDSKTPRFQRIISQLGRGVPLQYITGVAHFYGYIFHVDEHVLIPRPETEELVYEILNHPGLKHRTALRVLDIGTGSGCIPISIKKKKSLWEVHATDISPAALEIAGQNAKLLDAPIFFHLNDILNAATWDALPQADIIVSNPPYILPSEKEKMPLHVLDHEPHLALFVENDALLFYEKIMDFAKGKLKPHGYLFFELNEYHSRAIREAALQRGFEETRIILDMQGKERVLVCAAGEF